MNIPINNITKKPWTISEIDNYMLTHNWWDVCGISPSCGGKCNSCIFGITPEQGQENVLTLKLEILGL